MVVRDQHTRRDAPRKLQTAAYLSSCRRSRRRISPPHGGAGSHRGFVAERLAANERDRAPPRPWRYLKKYLLANSRRAAGADLVWTLRGLTGNRSVPASRTHRLGTGEC